MIIRKVLNLVNNDLKTVIRLAGTGTKHLGIRQKQRRRIETYQVQTSPSEEEAVFQFFTVGRL